MKCHGMKLAEILYFHDRANLSLCSFLQIDENKQTMRERKKEHWPCFTVTALTLKALTSRSLGTRVEDATDLVLSQILTPFDSRNFVTGTFYRKNIRILWSCCVVCSNPLTAHPP